MWKYIRHLEVLCPPSDPAMRLDWPQGRVPLRRHWINARKEKRFVALSYTWEESDDEDKTHERYAVQARDKARYFPCKVRDCVFERILEYMRVHDIFYLWIDRYCIAQRACKAHHCKHKKCATKRKALHASDLVYGNSQFPVALLGREMNQIQDVRLLAKIMGGRLVVGGIDGARLSRKTSREEVRGALALLDAITSDKWWTRAWTFQENYRGGTRMTLLIHHSPDFEKTKREFGDVFGYVPGELSIQSTSFFKHTTLLCLAALEESLEIGMVHRILRAAGRYSILLHKSESMTSRIIADLQFKEATVASDILAIIANCCTYPVRLDVKSLDKEDISVNILALRLLNGEVFHNGRGRNQYLTRPKRTTERFFFSQFEAPPNHHRLTYNKHCRFDDVYLTSTGVETTGHLWKLEKLIRTDELLPGPLRLKPSKRTLITRDRLTQLRDMLRDNGAQFLAEKIDHFIRYNDWNSPLRPLTRSGFSRHWVSTMIQEVIAAMEDGKVLRLGRLYGSPTNETPQSSALFIYKDDAHREPFGPSDYAFTVLRPKSVDDKLRNYNDLHRHVSIQVEVAGLADSLPRLYFKQWMPGSCFFSGCPRRKVVFPWPDIL
ncbi:unnamed protein product [Clonostachys solani]|uniref:Heterokaryon incompatibility domain-containing protein n=1 Tax=Clonostachys solani TaxID=160281 RepID=A0A9N9YYH1_9HYPO|nr:unnamed protein product [Clonostachys solani]